MHGEVQRLNIVPESGCAFVHFTTVDEAQEAWSKLNGVPVGSKALCLRFTKGTNNNPSRTLWVGNVDCNRDDLFREFAKYCKPLRINRCLRKNYAFIDFESCEEAISAKKHMDGKRV